MHGQQHVRLSRNTQHNHAATVALLDVAHGHLLADLAASFQAAVVETLVGKTMRAVDHVGARALSLGGGVACNRELRARLADACASREVALRIPSPRLCADNAAMIALLGSWMLERGERSDPELDAVASLEESGLPIPSA